LIVVLDTNILVRAAFRRNTDPDNVLARAKRGEFETAVSGATLRELITTFAYERIQRRLEWNAEEQASFISEYIAASSPAEPITQLAVVRDPSDNRFLELAVEVGAEYIVTTDNDLLDLGEYEGVRIITQAEFMLILMSASQ
jgi:putative PIN family toxin of toxin-antitoxin system